MLLDIDDLNEAFGTVVGKLIGYRTDGNELLPYSTDNKTILGKATRSAVNKPFTALVLLGDKWVALVEFRDHSEALRRIIETLIQHTH